MINPVRNGQIFAETLDNWPRMAWKALHIVVKPFQYSLGKAKK
jgi:hypothetical protein